MKFLRSFFKETEADPTPLTRSISYKVAVSAGTFAVCLGFLIVASQLHAFQFMRSSSNVVAVDTVGVANAVQSPQPFTYSLRDLDNHPLKVYPAFFMGLGEIPEGASPYYRQFFDLLDVYANRQGVDDNFTLRVMDSRSGKLLELYSIDSLRTRYKRDGYIIWDQVDWHRRTATRQLVEKWSRTGIPREHISVRWGRADQVRESRLRKEAIVEYELRLARSLGLSVLPTEIGTVETFNQDHLVSPAGARSRYQMMPNFLRSYQLSTHEVPAAAGRPVAVRDELHPLLSLEPAFTIVRAYSNAVGHEIPGISAYHTGPGNIFNIYNMFLTQSRHLQRVDEVEFSVVDAFIWGLTDGFPIVSERSSFKDASRGYIPSAIGTLRAVDEWQIDPSRTLRLERVQLNEGINISLSRLMSILDQQGPELEWGWETREAGPYDRFRFMNPHFLLPEPVETNAFPATGNVTLQRASRNGPIRFFLPLGASEVLRAAGHDYIDRRSIFRYDEDTFRDPEETGEKTEWDRTYDRLVESTERFGFTPSHRQRLVQISQQLDLLADLTPTRYRLMQARIARLHLQMWQSAPFNKLSETVLAVSGSVVLPPRPPEMPSSRTHPRPVELSQHNARAGG